MGNNLNVIDQFLATFIRYIDGGFGLLNGDIVALSSILIGIDMALAGLFWALDREGEVLVRLVKKTLYVGAFAYIIGNFSTLATAVFNSFASLGIEATGAGLTAADLLLPGKLAGTGFSAAYPLLQQAGSLLGVTTFFTHFVTIVILLVAWFIVVLSFFILAVQLFITVLEFKLTSLAGFTLVPFAFWNKTAFLAERVLGNVISSGIKVMVLAVIVGIGSSIFGQFTPPAGATPTIDTALALMLASIALFGLGIFGPGIATGLVSGAPQLGAGAAAGTLLGAGGLAVAGGAATIGAARLATSAAGTGVRAASSMVKGARSAYSQSATASGASGARAMGAGLAGVGRAGAESVGNAAKSWAKRATGGAGASTNDSGSTPNWAQQLQRRQHVERGVSTAAQALRSGEHGGSGANPSLREGE